MTVDLLEEKKVRNRARARAWELAHPERKRARARAWYAKNREKIIARQRAWRAANREHIRTSHATWRAKNPEKVRSWTVAWQIANPEKVRATQQVWRAVNPEKCRAATRVWKAAHRDQELARKRDWHVANREWAHAQARAWRKAHAVTMRLHNLRRRARKMAAPATLTVAEWNGIITQFMGRCAYCDAPTFENLLSQHPQKRTQDHLVPLVRGGHHTVENIAPACALCNSRKHDTHWFFFHPNPWIPVNHAGDAPREQEEEVA